MEKKENSIKAKIQKNIIIIIIVLIIVIIILVDAIPDALREMAPSIDFETVNFGGYSWLVLDERDDKMLLLSEYILFEMAYSSTRQTNTWEDSLLRKYLNNEFFNTFNQAERELIILVVNENPDNPRFGTNGGNDTEDLVFILSLDEILKYFGDSGNRRSNGSLINDVYNARRFATDINGNRVRQWWVRTPGAQNHRAVYVGQSGGSDEGVILVNGGSRSPMSDGVTVTSNDVGVRPAMWVMIDGS